VPLEEKVVNFLVVSNELKKDDIITLADFFKEIAKDPNNIKFALKQLVCLLANDSLIDQLDAKPSGSRYVF